MLLLCWNVKFFFWRDLHCTSACLDLDAPFGKSFSLLSSSRVGAVFPEPFKLCIYCERAALVMTQYRGSAMLGLRPLCIVKKEYGSGTIARNGAMPRVPCMFFCFLFLFLTVLLLRLIRTVN